MSVSREKAKINVTAEAAEFVEIGLECVRRNVSASAVRRVCIELRNWKGLLTEAISCLISSVRSEEH